MKVKKDQSSPKAQSVVVPSTFLQEFFESLYWHVGWSRFYQKQVIVEPVCSFRRDRYRLAGCKSIDTLLYESRNTGQITANAIDENPSDFLQQAMDNNPDGSDSYILVHDSPILYPYERLRGFLEILRADPAMVTEVAGIAHYHVNQENLSGVDQESFRRYASEIIRLGGTEQIALVVSQQDPTPSLAMLREGKDKFIDSLLNEAAEKKINLSAIAFGVNKQSNLSLTVVS